MLATVKNKGLMKIYEAYIDSVYYQREETHIAGLFIDGGSKTEKRDKDRLKKHNQNNVKTRKLMLVNQEASELFLKNMAQYLVRKQVLPKT